MAAALTFEVAAPTFTIQAPTQHMADAAERLVQTVETIAAGGSAHSNFHHTHADEFGN